MHVLAGSAADAVSYEASTYGQGLLTYSLLEEMRGASLRDGEFIDVGSWFNYSADRVPQLAAGIGGIQRPMYAHPTGSGRFDVGQLTSVDRNRIPLAMPKPMVLRSNFQDERRPVDPLRLTALMDARLRDASARGGDASLVFVDAGEFSGAYLLSGRYRVSGESVTVRAFVFRGEEEVGTFEVSGSTADLDDIATRILAGAERVIGAGRN